ncbi:thiamine-phosphate diphosphorylase [Terriglobus roseus]|uniref:Thiamine-phosphate synthase n=1 Tax=Terriglobus roseus TaxID=392734 RepID=A0A1G7HY46_9BACT|nr:thiamine-phosphate diphosphorylase [Terriglobus roseus]
MTRDFRLPRLYAILDAESCARRGLALLETAKVWRDAGVTLMQYRDKVATDASVLENAALLRCVFEGVDATLILNDRVHLFAESGFDGVHVGQGDASVASVREVIGADAVLGISTHNPAQFADADLLSVSYVAVGPVFATSTKLDAEPVVGLDGVRLARSLTRKPLVAIGGITQANAASVLEAGADSVAVISGLLDGDVRGFVAAHR